MGTVYAKPRREDVKDFVEPPSQTETKLIDLTVVEARVDRVHIDGLVRTNDDLVKSSVKELFKADNFEDMIKSAHKVRSKLIDLGCFRSIAIHIDTSSGPNATSSGYEITYLVEELKRVTGGVTSHVDTSNNEGMLSVAMSMPNIFGNGEHIKGECTYGSKRTRNFNITAFKPMISELNIRPSLSVFQNESEWPMSGYKVIDRGILTDLFLNSGLKLKHNFIWEGIWRQVGVGNKYASFEVRKDAGHTLKSSIKHIVTYDKRDSMIFPTAGSFAKLTSEIAGFGGNVMFLKNDCNLQFNSPIVSKDVILQASFNMGLLNQLGNNEINICDNFFLGGPITLRGFDFRAVGPKKDNDFVGGNYYWSGALHIYSPLPFKPGSGGFGDLFRTHIFINAGNVGDFKISDFRNWLDEQKDCRVASGIGIALRLGHMARVELNYCIPLLYKEDKDLFVKGIQFGVGVNFL